MHPKLHCESRFGSRVCQVAFFSPVARVGDPAVVASVGFETVTRASAKKVNLIGLLAKFCHSSENRLDIPLKQLGILSLSDLRLVINGAPIDQTLKQCLVATF